MICLLVKGERNELEGGLVQFTVKRTLDLRIIVVEL